jgi:hypothetical protein
MPKLKKNERILKASRENCQVTYNGKDIRITPVLSYQTQKAMKAWKNIIQRSENE